MLNEKISENKLKHNNSSSIKSPIMYAKNIYVEDKITFKI
jgi:hypothetical protein